MKFTLAASIVLAGLVAGLLVVAPLAGWPPTLRLSAVLGGAALLAVAVFQPWRWTEEEWRRIAEYEPSSRAVATAAVLTGALLLWIVVTLFEGGHINGVDFTIYFDRPLYQTIHGRPLYVETTDDPQFEHLSHLAVHAYWLLILLSPLYMVHASPFWLHALSVAAIVAGGVYVVRIGRATGLGGLMSVAAALAFVLNDNTARTLRYGFHPEVLYAWFVPWLLDAGLRGAKRSYVCAAVATVLVKEDACLPLFAAVVALLVIRRRQMTMSDRVFYATFPLALALANLVAYYMWVVPALWPSGRVAYSSFWANYGDTPARALLGIIAHPMSVLRDVWTSGLLRIVLPPFLFLPWLGWRWAIGIVPLAIIFAASANDQVHAFGIYYAIPMVPFLSLAAAAGALTLARRLGRSPRAVPIAAACVTVGALVVGRGYALRSWRTEVAAVPRAVASLTHERVVLVQSGLYPHAGYDARVQLLTPRALRDSKNADAALLIARGIGSYPFLAPEFESLFHARVVAPMPGGLVAVRNR